MDKQDYPATWRITYHFVWAPMRAKACLVGEVAQRLEELIGERAQDVPMETYELLVLPDRVYLAVKAPPTVAPHHIMCQVKAYTSRVLRAEFPELTRIPTLWTRAYVVLAGESLTKEDVLRLYESARAPRRPRGRPRKERQADSDAAE
jgi:REP-associated tyrosine transposase